MPSTHNIPLQLALDCTENAIKKPTVEPTLLKDDIMNLLNLCLTSTYFKYNGTVMGSVVSMLL